MVLSLFQLLCATAKLRSRVASARRASIRLFCTKSLEMPVFRATSGMRSLTTLTKPPIAPLPYSSVIGPRKISICRALNVSIDTAWSGLIQLTSRLSMPLSITRTRALSCPRIIGRADPGANALDCTPSSPASVSPMVAPRFCRSASPFKTVTGLAVPKKNSRKGLAVTTIGSSSSFSFGAVLVCAMLVCAISALHSAKNNGDFLANFE